MFEFHHKILYGGLPSHLNKERQTMIRTEITAAILKIFNDQFEIDNPDLDAPLRDTYEFDSIDAIELLREIEILLGTQLTREEKKAAMEIRTINHIVDYIETIAVQRAEKA
jgi:acyl carrier protein